MAYKRLEKLRARRLDPMIKTAAFSEVYERMKDDDSIRYAIGAMQPIDPEYTKNTYGESDRIQNQLKDKVPAEFDHQGSVTNDTHIKAHSDIDLLIVHTSSFVVQLPNRPISPYTGNPIADLIALRNTSTQIVEKAFPEANVDKTGARSVSLSGGSLRRKIDMVFCNWWHTVEYVKTNHRFYLGIHVLDKNIPDRIPNKPFLHNALINSKDSDAKGNYRKLVRLLKSLKYDSDRKDTLSSYDICAIVYSMEDNRLNWSKGCELQLMQSCNQFMLELISNEQKRNSLWVPNGTRLIFCSNGATLQQLKVMQVLLQELLTEIEQGLTRSFTKLAEARVSY